MLDTESIIAAAPQSSRSARPDGLVEPMQQGLIDPLRRCSGVQPGVIQAQGLVIQRIVVGQDDIGRDFNVRVRGGAVRVGTLRLINLGGWYRFEIAGEMVNIQGRDNILSAVDDSSSADEEDEEGYYSSDFLPTDQQEFDISDLAETHGSVMDALLRVRNSFRQNPRTMRVHYPFGSKTVSKGGEAFTTPDESEKSNQAMVSYRLKDYDEHDKVGHDYDEWADELSGSEDESAKQDLARDIIDFLEDDEGGGMDFEDLEAGQRAALGGLVSVAFISDPLRTEHNSTRTESDFMEGLYARERGETTFHDVFGSKSDSTFLPARSGGSGQQRVDLRERAEEEIRGEARLWQNNCLINAICLAAHGRTATLMELMTIRFNLGGVGHMMVASPASINAIRNVLGINNPIRIRYPVAVPALNEDFVGVGLRLDIFHTGLNHFQHNAPFGVAYR